jgi:hypothetical protein
VAVVVACGLQAVPGAQHEQQQGQRLVHKVAHSKVAAGRGAATGSTSSSSSSNSTYISSNSKH